MRPRFIAVLLLLAAAPAAYAQAPATPAETWPLRIPSSGGEVILPSAGAKRAYDEIKYASSRRVGDTLYVSGVIAGGGQPGKPADPEVFKASLRNAFGSLERSLKAAGGGFEDVVMINSFHVWQSPHFTGGRDEHFKAVSEVKDEFMAAPHPAWTAVGTTGLLAETGLVEIQMIAHVPPKGRAAN
ncbi:MAG TPA: Rid family hydrolase [Caulobacteraceae bacterium]|jgi:enamine deaminase RidA (YjgF/YER057c/UK114 family)